MREYMMLTATFNYCPHDDDQLDPGIAPTVRLLRKYNVETIESCQGGEGHCLSDPTVIFDGDRSEGFRALAVALRHGLDVLHLRRRWSIIDGEPTGPVWEMTFRSCPIIDPAILESPKETE